jgi:hypothetical protein
MGARLANPQPAACGPGRLNPARAWELECVKVGGGWLGVFSSPEVELKGRENDGPMELLIRLGCIAGFRVGEFVEKLVEGLLAKSAVTFSAGFVMIGGGDLLASYSSHVGEDEEDT